MATSAEIAARFVARREQPMARRRGRTPVAPRRIAGDRIALDLAEPTLRLIHDVLLDALHAGLDFSDRGALLMIAEQMVAMALGIPPCDDPPLTDRQVR